MGPPAPANPGGPRPRTPSVVPVPIASWGEPRPIRRDRDPKTVAPRIFVLSWSGSDGRSATGGEAAMRSGRGIKAWPRHGRMRRALFAPEFPRSLPHVLTSHAVQGVRPLLRDRRPRVDEPLRKSYLGRLWTCELICHSSVPSASARRSLGRKFPTGSAASFSLDPLPLSIFREGSPDGISSEICLYRSNRREPFSVS